ncbi:DUF6429 family protein [Enterovibrio makurazakiensis]|uniref:DUF6429 family protein n=1 Tax=Enterovibrio makurazakiensis TaxID=2910232 RepID=UPI003D247AFA
MDYDKDKACELALALMCITFHDKSPFENSYRAWKAIDFEVMNQLHELGYIHNPVNKSKSVVLTPAGVEKAEEHFSTLLMKVSDDDEL